MPENQRVAFHPEDAAAWDAVHAVSKLLTLCGAGAAVGQIRALAELLA
jgi:hypothetical protein